MKNINIITIVALLIYNSLCYLQLQIFKTQLKQTLKNKKTQCITLQIDEQRQKKGKKKKNKRSLLGSKDQNSQKSLKKQKDQQKDEDDQQQRQSGEQQNSQDQQIDDEDIPESQNYKQICYDKDVSYYIPMTLNNAINFISVDTTIPVGWYKGPNCRLEATSTKCTKINSNFKQRVVQLFKQKLKKQSHSKSDFAIIQGSSQLVKGIQEKGKEFHFITRDSSRLTNFFQLLMLGFFIKGEKDNIILQNTTFISAVQINKELNYLSDGAISLRFDSLSQNSFLNELFIYQKIPDKYVTIQIGPINSSISFGQVAVKYSKNGYGGLQWVNIQEDESYGKLPVITDIIVQSKDSNNNFFSIKDKQYPAVISLSASYIGFPKKVMAKWFQKFNKKTQCQINQKTKYLQCNNFHRLKQKQNQMIITFSFNQRKISFLLSQLIIGKQKNKTLFNIKQTLHDTYAILGEPLFLKYLVVFDYNNNKVGFGQKFIGQPGMFINVVSIIRFVCLVFVFGCGFLACFLPLKRCFQVFKSRFKYGSISNNKGQTRRLKQYAPIQENPYQQLNGKVKQVLQS